MMILHLMQLALVVWSSSTTMTTAFTTTGIPPRRVPLLNHPYPAKRTTWRTMTGLSMSSSHRNGPETNDKSDNDDENIVTLERISTMAGVSVSPQGFQVVFQTATTQRYLVLPVTSSHEDAVSTTTPEALTIIQLINGVDMAGTILPPDILARMVVLHCEEAAEEEQEEWEAEHHQDYDEEDEDDEEDFDDDKVDNDETNIDPETEFVTQLSKSQQEILSFIQESLLSFQSSSSGSSSSSKSTLSSYTEAHPWIQNKLRLPTVTLDQLKLVLQVNEDDDTVVQIKEFQLECAIPQIGSLTLSPTEAVTSQVCYQYDAAFGTSQAFLAVALALRYKAPIVLEYINTAQNHKKKGPQCVEHKMIPVMDETLPYSRAPRSSIPSRLLETRNDVSDVLPLWTTVQKLQSSSRRVSQNIEQGFEIHKLQGALRIAMERGDQQAAKLIRAKLDEYDSMEDLPTTSDSDIASCSGITPSSPRKSAPPPQQETVSYSSLQRHSRPDDELDEDNILQ